MVVTLTSTSSTSLLYLSKTLKPNLRFEAKYNIIGKRPTERLGEHGGFDKGVVVLAGGKAHDVPLPPERNHGVVLFESSQLTPDMSWEGRTNVVGGRPNERLGSRGGFQRGIDTRAGGVPCDIPIKPELNHGTVLFSSSKLTPDMSYEGRTNAVGGRPHERLGVRGGFTNGVRIWAGGKPRDVPVKPEGPHGTVLYTSSKLAPVNDDDVELNERGDRHNSGHGAFTHGIVVADGGELRGDMPTAADWSEAGQKGGRRNGQGHYQAGVTMLGGGMPSYNSADN